MLPYKILTCQMRTPFRAVVVILEQAAPRFFATLKNDSGAAPRRISTARSGARSDCAPAKRKKRTLLRPFAFGWGTGIRTPEMSESESDALPLGDAPIFTARGIITEKNLFVKNFFQYFLFFSMLWRFFLLSRAFFSA